MKPIFTEGPLLGIRTLLLIVLSVGLLLTDTRTNQLHTLRNGLATAVMPIQYMVSLPADVISWSQSNFVSHSSLVAENTRLQAEAQLMQARLQKLLTLQHENNQLRELLSSAPTTVTKMLASQLISVNTNHFAKQFVIDKGKSAGVYLGQPVLDAYGVIGQVVQVNLLTSRVMLISDLHSAIPVQDVKSNTRAILIGDGDNQSLSLLHVPKTTKLKVGDELVTSGLGQCFPVGYPAGTISAVERESGRNFATITVTPKAHVSQSRLFLLVWPNKDYNPKGVS